MDPALRADLRAAARRFFALPSSVKQRYAVRIGGRGWLAPGVESNGNADVFGGGDAEYPPDLKESFAIGPATPTGDPDVDAVWFPANVWPSEVPELHAVAEPPMGRRADLPAVVSAPFLRQRLDAISV